jgi:hypothetical protein
MIMSMMDKRRITNGGMGLFLILAVSMLVACGGGNTSAEKGDGISGDSTAVAEITFNTLVHDFGVLTEGEKVAYVFTYTNTGTGSLVINSATTSCGCTVPQFSRKPLGPGQKGTMEVVFSSAGFGGIQTKTVTVQSNARTPVVVLAVKADVRVKNK